MMLACPECDTRYTVPDTAFGADGRMFRCAHCQHTWFAKAPQGMLVKSVEQSLPVFQEAVDIPAFPMHNIPSPASVAPVIKPGSGTQGLRSLCLFLLILIVALYPITYRKAILKNHPEFAGLYEVINIYNTNGLAIADARITKTPLENKMVRVKVACNIMNESEEKLTLPRLTEYLVNNSGVDVLKTRSLVEEGNKIGAGETVACKQFSFDMKENEIDSVRIDLADNMDLALRHKK